MIPKFDERANKILDEIIEARRSIRAFTSDVPPREMIVELIRAGLWAPYGALAVAGRSDFRRFFVLRRGTPAIEEAARLIRMRTQKAVSKTLRELGREPAKGNPGAAYFDRIKALAENGPPTLKAAPYYIVVAEYQGVPPCGLESLAHCLENMWLKATALGLAFQLVSVTEIMADDEEFAKLLGLPFGEYVLDGCAVGYPAAEPAKAARPAPAERTVWL